MMEQELATKRVEFIQTMKESMIDMDVNGNEIKFFASKFLVQKYLKLSSADLDLNEKLKKEEIEELHLAGGENSDEAAMGESIVDKIANMVVEKLTIKPGLISEDKEISPKGDKDIKKKKKTVKNNDNEEINKEEE
jgi:riboflavin biosynthesis pyrimidine reductase